MALTESTMLPLGTVLPDFSLPATDGRVVASRDFADAPAVLVMFICNHCPYVLHVRHEVAAIGREYSKRGVGIVAIASNDIERFPQDGPEFMAEEAEAMAYCFPYVFDADQSVAKTFRAACTPEFYVFDGQKKLVYRGRMDSSSPGNNSPVDGSELRAALDAALAGKAVVPAQHPSIGCNIKWKVGNAPEYA